MLTKSQLIDLFSEYNLKPLKRLGENYLIDGNIKDKIISEARPKEGDIILEIGPGLGALTIDLAKSGARIYAVEKDRKICALLKDIARDDFPNLELSCGDILKFDLKNIASSKKIKVVGNLPYYITTPILEWLIKNKDFIGSILITVQKEVAERLAASPGREYYSSISCFVQYYTKPEYVYTIKRNSFYPSPKVDSSLIRLDVLDEPPVAVRDEGLFFKIIRGAFNQRRKSIINSLSRKAVLNVSKDELLKLLTALGIDPTTRPERLNLAAFAKISNSIN